MSIHNDLLNRVEVPDTETSTDLLLLASVAVALTVIQLLIPESMKTVLAFDHASFNWWGLYTSAYIHHGLDHLADNVSAYLIAVGMAYWLCKEVDVRTWFRRSFGMLLLLLPPLTIVTSYVITGVLLPESLPAERGFSGVAAGFAGFLWTAAIVYVAKKYDFEFGVSTGVSIFIFLLLMVGFGQSGLTNIWVYILGCLGITVVSGFEIWQRDLSIDPREISIEGRRNVLAVIATVAVLGVLVRGMFPSSLVSDGMFVNIFGHFAGFLWAVPICTVVYHISPKIQSWENQDS